VIGQEKIGADSGVVVRQFRFSASQVRGMPGTYILVKDPCDSAEVFLCLAGEDDDGNICVAENEFEIHRDYLVAEFFRPIMGIDLDE